MYSVAYGTLYSFAKDSLIWRRNFKKGQFLNPHLEQSFQSDIQNFK